MAIHRADLHPSRKTQGKIDRPKVERYLTGHCDLAEGLGIDAEMSTMLRRQALALHDAGKWQRAIDVVLGLVALGSVHPADPMLLARCYRQLGQHDVADACIEHADRLLDAMGLEAPLGCEAGP